MVSRVVDASREVPDALTLLQASEHMRATCHAGWVANWLSVEHSHQLTSVGKGEVCPDFLIPICGSLRTSS